MPTPERYDYKDGRTTWRVRFRMAGRGSAIRSRTFASYRDALQFCKEVDAIGPAAALARHDRADAESAGYVPTVRDWLAVHVDSLTGVTPRTRADYRKLAERTFLPLVGNLRLDEVDRITVARLINQLEQQRTARGNGTLSAKTIANAHGLFSSMLRTAALDHKIPSNPAAGMRLPRSGEQDRQDARFLTHEEFARLHDALPSRWQPLATTLVLTGMRWSEATALQVGDVHTDPELPTIRIVRAWKRVPGSHPVLGPPKTRKGRRTIIPPAVVPLVLTDLLTGESTDLVFRAIEGGPIHPGNFRERVWQPALGRAGLSGVRIHDLRHTCASWLIYEGVPLEAIQDYLGHESILTTRKVYGHLQPSMMVALAAAGERAFSRLRLAQSIGPAAPVAELVDRPQRALVGPQHQAPGADGGYDGEQVREPRAHLHGEVERVEDDAGPADTGER